MQPASSSIEQKWKENVWNREKMQGGSKWVSWITNAGEKFERKYLD